jgi:putative transposase
MLDFHVSWRGNSIDAYLFIRRPVRRYGRVPIYTDGAPWYADACRWAGAERAAHGRPLRNLMERVVQYAKDRTEAFDDPFPVAGAGSMPTTLRRPLSFLVDHSGVAPAKGA